MMVPSFRH
ncbi:hypothetical protein ECTT12B_2957, partial [Escherichia coli TT12B]